MNPHSSIPYTYIYVDPWIILGDSSRAGRYSRISFPRRSPFLPRNPNSLYYNPRTVLDFSRILCKSRDSEARERFQLLKLNFWITANHWGLAGQLVRIAFPIFFNLFVWVFFFSHRRKMNISSTHSWCVFSTCETMLLADQKFFLSFFSFRTKIYIYFRISNNFYAKIRHLKLFHESEYFVYTFSWAMIRAQTCEIGGEWIWRNNVLIDWWNFFVDRMKSRSWHFNLDEIKIINRFNNVNDLR